MDVSWVGILWIPVIDLLNWLFHCLFWSEVSHSLILIKYRYKTSFQVQALYQDIQGSYKSRELSRLTYCSVWQFTSEAWPLQFSRFPHGIEYLTSIQWALKLVLLWRPPQVFALGESIGTLGMIPMSIAHTWPVSSLSCSDVSFLFGTSVLMVLFCPVLHARLCQSHEL